MAVDIKDVEQVAQELQQKFDDFKAKNDKRVDAIEQEKGKLAGQVETLNGKLSELENLKSDLEKELLELKRPAGGAQNKLATEHKEAFVGFLRKGREDGLRDLERKALQVGTDEDGGYAVPEALDRNILTLLKDEVVMRQEATVITVGGSDYKKLVNLGGTASGWVGETDTRSQTATSRLELIEPLMGEIYGNPQATQKMLDDAFFNVEAWINSELATEFAEQEEIAFTSGDGTKKPKGFLAYESTDETDKVRAFGKLQHIVSGDATAVDEDFDTDDRHLQLLACAAQKRTETYLNRKLYAPDETIPDSDPDGLHLPDDIRLGMLMLISHFYENRSSVTEVEKLDMPQSFGWLVGPYRYFPQ
ncbi:phage major capsid protein [Escherichia coli]